MTDICQWCFDVARVFNIYNCLQKKKSAIVRQLNFGLYLYRRWGKELASRFCFLYIYLVLKYLKISNVYQSTAPYWTMGKNLLYWRANLDPLFGMFAFGEVSGTVEYFFWVSGRIGSCLFNLVVARGTARNGTISPPANPWGALMERILFPDIKFSKNSISIWELYDRM